LQLYRTEFSQLAKLALPLVVTQLAQMSMSVADTVMAGRVSSADLAGVALGTTVFWPLLFLVAGTTMAITPTVAQLRGSDESEKSGEVVRQAMWASLVGGIVLFFVFRNLMPLYQFVGVDPQALPITKAYLDAMSWGVVPVLMYFCLRYMSEGLGWTIPAMLISFSALLFKIPLNYWFIHGGFGVTAMGGEGCGWSTAIVMCYQFTAMAAVIHFSRLKSAGLFANFSWPDLPAIGRLIGLGAPIGLSTFAEFSIFSAMTLLIGRLGIETLAAHQIASNIGALSYMVPMALGMAASIRVGFNVGKGDFAAARLSGWVAIFTSLAFAFVVAALLISFNEFIASLYTTQNEVLLLASELLLLVAIYRPFDDVQATALGTLRGFKDTRVPFYVAICAYWLVGFPVALVLGFGSIASLDLGVYGYWVGLIVGLIVASGVLVARFQYLAKRPDKVQQFAMR